MTDTPITTADRVFQALRDQILFGKIKPGTRLTHRQLAAEFGTSNIPVVESIRRLEGDGLLVTHPKWGSQVNEWTSNDIEGIFAMREGLEATTCRIFAEQASEIEKLSLLEYSQRYDECARTQNIRSATEADIALHLHIVRCTGSINLYRLAETSCVITTTIRNHRIPDDELFRAYVAGLPGIHDDLVAALCSGDPERAEQAGRAHVLQALRKVRDLEVTNSTKTST